MRIIVKDKKNGVTLIELIIAMAIFTIIIGGAYSIFGFGNNTYSKGVKQYDIQSSIRLANDYITQQIRYAMNIQIKDSGFVVPDQSTLDPYQNYIYYDGNSIVHLNKYFKKEFQIGNKGKISFLSIDPYKELSFDIEAESGKQKYNIKGDIYPLNLHLGVGIVEGTIDVGKKSGSIIFFKTANDFMAEKLKPIASIGSKNQEKQFKIEFDREIIESQIISFDKLTNPKVTFTSGAKVITLVTDSSSDGGKAVIRITFGGLEAYGNTYDYTAIYDPTSKWTIE